MRPLKYCVVIPKPSLSTLLNPKLKFRKCWFALKRVRKGGELWFSVMSVDCGRGEVVLGGAGEQICLLMVIHWDSRENFWFAYCCINTAQCLSSTLPPDD